MRYDCHGFYTVQHGPIICMPLVEHRRWTRGACIHLPRVPRLRYHWEQSDCPIGLKRRPDWICVPTTLRRTQSEHQAPRQAMQDALHPCRMRPSRWMAMARRLLCFAVAVLPSLSTTANIYMVFSALRLAHLRQHQRPRQALLVARHHAASLRHGCDWVRGSHVLC